MSLELIKYYYYDTDDVVARCPYDGGPLVSDPTLWHLVDANSDTQEALELGEIVIAFCPTKGHVAIVKDGKVLKVFSLR